MFVSVLPLGPALLLLASLSTVRAQVEGFIFEPDNLTKGDLVVWCIWTVLYLALLVLCFVALAIRKGHRLIYVILLPAILLTILQCLANIVYIVLSNNELTFEGPPGGVAPVSAMGGISYFAGNISNALFFLGVSLLFIDRYKAINQAAVGSSKFGVALSVTAFVYSAFLFVLGLAAAGLTTSATVAFWQFNELIDVDENALPEFIDEAWQNYRIKAERANDMSYAYAASVDLTIFFIVGLGIIALRDARRYRLSDMVSKIATFLTIPLYAIFTILSYIVFVVVFSPAGVKSFTGFEQSQLTADVLQNLFFYLSILSVVVLGLIRTLWDVKVQQERQYGYQMAQADEYHKPSFPPQSHSPSN